MKSKTIILIAVIVIGGGFMFYMGMNYQTNDNTNNSNTAVSPSDDDADTNSMNLYVNPDYGYRLELPEDWTIEEDSAEYVAFFDPVAQQQEIVSELMMGMKMEVYITELDGMTFEEQIENNLAAYSSEELLERKDVVVDGKDAVKIKTYTLGYTVMTYVDNDDVVIGIAGNVGNEQEDSKYVALYSQILSSFEFLVL